VSESASRVGAYSEAKCLGTHRRSARFPQGRPDGWPWGNQNGVASLEPIGNASTYNTGVAIDVVSDRNYGAISRKRVAFID
jgi:hypothetical protein